MRTISSAECWGLAENWFQNRLSRRYPLFSFLPLNRVTTYQFGAVPQRRVAGIAASPATSKVAGTILAGLVADSPLVVLPGKEVARFMAQQEFKGIVIIHSRHVEGAAIMKKYLPNARLGSVRNL